ELMFGPQLRECIRRIDELESQVGRTDEDLRGRLDELRVALSHELTSAAADGEKRIKAADLRAGEGMAELRVRLDEIEDRSSTRLRALEDGIAALQEETRRRIDAVQESLSASFRASLESLEKRLQALATEVQMQGSDLRRQAQRSDERFEGRIR